ncbi:gluconolaconase [Croceicoccus ponticola]|uniref:Gluconolaconase n=1 Tax=Croceicoccus ponticola TaxID=2217664 RepID=A0A437GXM2_9SPHN|nr:SMP-30/gluconolactonase/LRE family protein [Croceicoccus ponticola]RVQ67144.1 gluconolaconase [Croceicoccus ponticola]
MQTTTLGDFKTIAEGYEFVEAPRVSPCGDLWFGDLTGRGVYRKRSGHPDEAMLPGRQWVGGILFDESGLVLCSGRDGIVTIDPVTGHTHDVLTHIDGVPVIAVNDMEGDGRGGFYAGTIDFVSIFEKGTEPSPGKFFHVSAGGTITVLRSDVFASNGIATSACGRWLYHSETSRGIWRYPLDGDGMPGPGELFMEIEDSDGLVADSAGNLWVACWSTARVIQFSEQGEMLQSVSLPFPHVVSLDFAASDPGGLYVSTGGNAEHPGKGAVIRMEVEIPGLAGPRTKLGEWATKP